MNPKAVIKVGGSLSRGEGLVVLCRAIGDLGRHHDLLVVPGGGDFADAVRETYQKYGLGETAAHHMAVLAMDQYGYLLNHLIPESFLIDKLDLPLSEIHSGCVPILLPSVVIKQRDPLPHSWQVTSDTIAAWVADRVGCNTLVMLKDVDGLLETNHDGSLSKKIILEMNGDQLSGHKGGVDEYLGYLLGSIDLEAWIINGLYPDRLTKLLDSGYTEGTRIISSRKQV